MENRPTHEQGQMQLQIFELRREAKLRQARDWFFRNYFPETFEQGMRIAAPGTDNGAYVMMVVSYWDQACTYLNYGLLHEDLFFETNGEFYGVWERMKPTIAEGRRAFSNTQFLANLEKAAGRYEQWIEKRSPGAIAAMRQFMKQMREQSGKAAEQHA